MVGPLLSSLEDSRLHLNIALFCAANTMCTHQHGGIFPSAVKACASRKSASSGDAPAMQSSLGLGPKPTGSRTCRTFRMLRSTQSPGKVQCRILKRAPPMRTQQHQSNLPFLITQITACITCLLAAHSGEALIGVQPSGQRRLRAERHPSERTGGDRPTAAGQ